MSKSDIQPVLGLGHEKHVGFHVQWIEHWSQLFGRCNWYTFTPFQFEFEWDGLMGGVEFMLIVAGFGVRVRWNYAYTDAARDVDASIRATCTTEARP